MKKIKITIEQLESLLKEQKELTIHKCLGHSYYNKNTTESEVFHYQWMKLNSLTR